MAQTDEDTLTIADITTLYRDGRSGFEASITRLALHRTVEDWDNHPEKAERLETLRQSSIGYEQLTPEVRHDPDEGYTLAPNSSPGVLNSTKRSGLFRVAGEFAQDCFDHHCELHREMVEDSSLTKRQYIVYLMVEGEKTETQIAQELDMEVGTVRSHAGRAREKIKTAKNTANIPSMFDFGGYDKLQADMEDMLEPDPSSAAE